MHNSQCTIHNYDKAADLQDGSDHHHGGCDLCSHRPWVAELQRDPHGDDPFRGMATRGHQRGHSDKDRGDV